MNQLFQGIQRWTPKLQKGEFSVINGHNKQTMREVDIKIISKKNMTLSEIEELR